MRLGGVVLLLVLPYLVYTQCRIEVPTRHMAVLIGKVGDHLENGEELAPLTLTKDEATGEEIEIMDHKGVQQRVLAEGRHYYNPFLWDWVVVPQIEIPEGKLGVRIRLYGDCIYCDPKSVGAPLRGSRMEVARGAWTFMGGFQHGPA